MGEEWRGGEGWKRDRRGKERTRESQIDRGLMCRFMR